MSLEKIFNCPVCDNNYFESFLETCDYTVTKEKFELKRCTKCTFLITNPRPTIKAIPKYYASEKYISHSGGTKTLFDNIYLLARTHTLKWKFQLIEQFASTHQTILDYGCGTGEFLFYVQKQGINSFGVEPNENARKKANIKLRGRVLENLDNLRPGSFSLITLWHVLEHVHDLNKTIQHLKTLLNESGHIIIAVPNPNSHDSLKYKDTWAGYDVPRHLWHFTQQTMKQLLNRNGLNVVDIKPMKLDSYYVSLLSEEYKNPKQFFFTRAIKAFLEGFQSNISARKNSQYSSLIYIAKHQ